MTDTRVLEILDVIENFLRDFESYLDAVDILHKEEM